MADKKHAEKIFRQWCRPAKIFAENFLAIDQKFWRVKFQARVAFKNKWAFLKCPNLLRHFENVFSPASKKPALPKLQGGRVSDTMALAVGAPTPSANKSRGSSSENERHFCTRILSQNANKIKAWRVKF